MSTHTLRVVWPILDEAMYDDEAMAEAWFDWPKHPEQHQVTVLDNPRMDVIRLEGWQRLALKADRAVVCEAPVVQRIPTKEKSMNKSEKAAV
jgi:hypothetical protein